MRTRIVTTPEELRKLRAPWEELHRVSKGTLFQHPDWLTAWWEVYGSSRDLKICTFWSDALLVGIIPAFTDTSVRARVRFRRTSFLGEIEAHGEYFPLVEDGSVEETARQASEYFLDELKRGVVDVVDFHGFPAESGFMRSFMDGMRRGAVLRYDPEAYPHIVTEGPANGEAYFRSLSTGRRRGLRRDRKALHDVGAEIEVASDWCGGKPYEDLARLHAARWNSVGQPGRLGRPNFGRFLPEVTECLMSTGNARIYFIRFQGERVAASLVFNMHRQHYGYLNGRDPVHPLMRYSAGDVLSLRLMMDAFDEGCDCFDLMGGDYRYKQFTGTTKRWYARLTAIAAGWRGLKARLYFGGLNVRDALNNVRNFRLHARAKEDVAKE